MAFPLDVIVELELAGVWTDITALKHVYQRDPITIGRGRTAEGALVDPSWCNLTLNNRSGDYSPRNPTGAHFGVLGRNTPLRVKVGADIRFTGEVPSWPQRWDTSGKDVWVPIVAAGIMRRLGQGQTALKSALYRALTSRLDDVVAYWPCEDGEDATELASALPGYPPMTFTGDLDLASFTDFKASSPLPTMSGVPLYGVVPAYTDTGEIQVRFLLAVPAAGVATTAIISRVVTEGTDVAPGFWASRWDLLIAPSGLMTVNVYDGEDTLLQTTGSISFGGMNGSPRRMAIELTQVGGDVDWQLRSWEVGGTSYTTGDTVVGRVIGRARVVAMNRDGDLDGVALGHVSVQDTLSEPDDELAAWAGETAGRRVERLCSEEGVTFSSVGTLDDTAALGPQLPKTLLELLREAAAADLGILYEPRAALGLAYRTRESLYAQAAALGLDYATADLSSIEPVDDDQTTRNDVTAKRDGGSSARAELTSGALSTAAPPDGVGRYDEEVTISVELDADLTDQAGWRLHLGTVDEARYPVLGINLARPNFTGDAALTAAAQALDVGDRLVVANPPAWLPPDDIQQLAQGFTETLTRHQWTIDVNCSPASPWDVGVWVEESVLVLDGSANSFASTPDAAALDITGDIDLRVKVAMDDWTPAAAQTLLAKWLPTGNQRSYALQMNAAGTVSLMWSEDGTAIKTLTSTVATGRMDGAMAWVRGILVVNDGFGNHSARFFTSTNGVTWIELGSPQTVAGTTSIFASTATVQVGALDGAARLAGDVFEAKIIAGIIGPTVVANPDFSAQPDGTTSFVDDAGRTWTVGAGAEIVEVIDVSRYSSDGSTLGEALTTTETDVDVVTPTGPLWSAADQPFDIYVGGERMTVTAVAGATSPQTFTVTRSVNGVVKNHATGAEVRLFKQAYYAL